MRRAASVTASPATTQALEENAMRARGAAILLAACALASCRPPTEGPRQAGTLKTAVRPVRVSNASFEGMKLLFDVEFDNSSPAALSVASIDYKVSLAARPWTDYQPWAEGKAGKGVAIEPRTKTVTTIPVDIPFDKLRKAMPLVARHPQVGYIIRADVHLDAGQGRMVKVPLRGQSVIGVPVPPTISLARLEVKQLDVHAGRLDLIVRVTNPNAFRATVKLLKGNVSLAGTPVAAIELTPNTALAPGGSAELAVPLPLDFRRLGAALHAAIDSGKVDVRLAGAARVLIPYGEPSLSLDLTKKVRVRR